jgi:uncharacterized protein YndB with AHSA1/START domain
VARFSRTIHIAAPPERVFAFFTDPARLKELDPHIQTVAVDMQDGRPHAVHFVILPAPGKAPIPIDGRVTAYEPGRTMGLESLPSAPGPVINLRCSCAEAGNGTDLTCDLELMLRGPLGGLADVLIRRQLEQSGNEALERTKQALEL